MHHRSLGLSSVEGHLGSDEDSDVSQVYKPCQYLQNLPKFVQTEHYFNAKNQSCLIRLNETLAVDRLIG